MDSLKLWSSSLWICCPLLRGACGLNFVWISLGLSCFWLILVLFGSAELVWPKLQQCFLSALGQLRQQQLIHSSLFGSSPAEALVQLLPELCLVTRSTTVLCSFTVYLQACSNILVSFFLDFLSDKTMSSFFVLVSISPDTCCTSRFGW